MKKRKILALLFVTIFTVQVAVARPAFGTEDRIERVKCGDCYCDYIISDTYIFWIKIGTNKELLNILC